MLIEWVVCLALSSLKIVYSESKEHPRVINSRNNLRPDIRTVPPFVSTRDLIG